MNRWLCAFVAIAATGCARAPSPAPEAKAEHASELAWVPHQALSRGDTALVDGQRAFVSDGGDVHVYALSNSVWVEEQVLQIEGVTLTNGLAASGDTLVAQAVSEPWVFERIGGVWVEQQELSPINGQFGRAVAIDGDTAMVGTPNESYSGGSRGAVYVFERDGGVWTQTQRIQTPDLTATSRGMGASIALEGNRALFGADDADFNRGAAMYLERVNGTWTHQEVLKATGPNGEPVPNLTLLGQSVSMHGDRAVIGGPGTQVVDGIPGRSFVFERSGNTWSQVAELLAPGVADSERFGASVALHGDVAIVGADRHHGVDTLRTGAAFVFTYDGGAWSHTVRLLGSSPRSGGRVGRSVSLSGDVGIVASFDASDVYTFAGGMCSTGDTCGVGACVDGVCCNAACAAPCDRCDVAGAEGQCVVAPHGTISESSCGAYVCDGVDTTCPTECRYDGDCADGYYCPSGPAPGPCVAQPKNGESCADNRECASGVCLDGLCCNTPCTETCASCTVAGSEGTCSPVAAGTQGNCAPFVCDGSQLICPEQCEDDSACPVGLACNINHGAGFCTDGPVCTVGHIVKTPEATSHCDPYRCIPDQCLDHCTTTADCVTPNVCNAEGKCVAAEQAPVRVGGCTMAPAHESSAAWLLMMLAACTRRRDNA